MRNARDILAQRVLLFDGGMGTYYKGRPGQECEQASLTDPEGVLAVHREYLEAGAEAIKTNTFGLPRMAAAHVPGWQQLARAAWALAWPDDLIEGFGEHHGLLGGMLEAVIKPRWPEDFRRIIDITGRFSWGWRQIHNPDTGHKVADNLTSTEFAVAMLVVRGWTTDEIAAHMKVSASTIKKHQAQIKRKLKIDTWEELEPYMLA